MVLTPDKDDKTHLAAFRCRTLPIMFVYSPDIERKPKPFAAQVNFKYPFVGQSFEPTFVEVGHDDHRCEPGGSAESLYLEEGLVDSLGPAPTLALSNELECLVAPSETHSVVREWTAIVRWPGGQIELDLVSLSAR